jgi:hypothetical protein
LAEPSTDADDKDMHLTEGYYEIIGSVKDDKSVKALTSIELGPNLGKRRPFYQSSNPIIFCISQPTCSSIAFPTSRLQLPDPVM